MIQESESGVIGAQLSGQARATYVQDMFARIVPRYDLFNTLSTFGQDRLWRKLAVKLAALPPNGQVLDVGTGTGAIAFALASSAPGAQVTGLDFCAPMIEAAQAKASGMPAAPHFVVGDALDLPYPDKSFDAVTSAFTVRNVASIQRAFTEMYRVLKPGGRVVCLEMSHPHWSLVEFGFRLYFYHVVPLLGAMLSGDRAAYTYLPNSLTRFPGAAGLAALMRVAGFTDVSIHRLNFGTVACHVGVKPEIATQL